jgi:hypothetical protein
MHDAIGNSKYDKCIRKSPAGESPEHEPTRENKGKDGRQRSMATLPQCVLPTEERFPMSRPE